MSVNIAMKFPYQVFHGVFAPVRLLNYRLAKVNLHGAPPEFQDSPTVFNCGGRLICFG
jgi:hypothetical protein